MYSISLGSGYATSAVILNGATVNDASSFFAHIQEHTSDSNRFNPLSNYTEQQCISYIEDDDNALYCPGHPEVGNAVIANFYANHAEGGSVKAIGKYSHAEGRATIADCRYSHAEGDKSKSYGMAEYSEGISAVAYGYSSHAEGGSTTASGSYSHAEGKSTTASGSYSHAEGGSTTAAGTASHAEGGTTTASSSYSHAEGTQTSALGIASHASGIKTNVSSDYAFGWNGNRNETYSSHGRGTFNINPVDDISGFYIGGKNLASYIDGISSSVARDYATKAEVSDISAKLSIVIGETSADTLVSAKAYADTKSTVFLSTFTNEQLTEYG